MKFKTSKIISNLGKTISNLGKTISDFVLRK